MSDRSFKIKDVFIEHPFISAPLAGISGPPYRKLVKRFGASLVFSEMISAKALAMKSKKTFELAYFYPQEKPFAAQLFGDEPDTMAEAARILEATGIDLIDINMGCPVPKVLKTGGGAKLLQSFETAAAIVKAITAAIKIPVTVKTRIGWSNDLAGLDMGLILQEAGASAITYHARTCKQKYSGDADWAQLKKAKKMLDIPVIGSGDIFTAQNAVDMLHQTQVDGVMIARGAFGYPWIFKEALSLLANGETGRPPAKKEKIEECLRFLKDTIDFYGDNRGVSLGRKHILWFLKGMPGSHKVKEEIMQTREVSRIEQVLEDFGNC